MLRARSERDAARAATAKLKSERDEATKLLREHARLWAADKDGKHKPSASPLASCTRDGNFSYYLFNQQRDTIGHPDNPYNLGNTTFARLLHESGPVRFDDLPAAGEPDEAIAFTTVCTNKFAPGLELLASSLLNLYPDLKSDFWVYHDGGLSKFTQRRLQQLYPNFRFADRDVSPYIQAAEGDSPNQQRIGALGYLTIESLKLANYDRVIILDSDLLARKDISPLWSNPRAQDVRVVPDAGTLPFTTSSRDTENVVFNSGVISLPKNALGHDKYLEAIDFLPHIRNVQCPILRQFADQKFWNIYLQRYEITLLPNTYNANKQLLDRHLPENFADAAIIHYTNNKPWFTFASRDLVDKSERKRAIRDYTQFPMSFGTWNSSYRQFVGKHRRDLFLQNMASYLDKLKNSAPDHGAVLIGNGPSLAATDLTVLHGRVSFAFNWFVNHEEFDDVTVDHLMVMSHMFFGGWQSPSPAFPDGYLERLLAHRHRPTLWFPFYFRELVEATPELRDYEVRYLLFEKPFKAFADDLGFLRVDLYNFLSDAHTGVLTAGLPLALHMGCRDIVLVGCDASYGRTNSGSDYFYTKAKHMSPSTDTSSLHSAWSEDGTAQYCYRLGYAAAEEAGVKLRDATIDGLLTAIPKEEIRQLRRRSP